MDRLAKRGIEVTAAFWLKVAEDGQWFLYIATPVVEKSGLPAAYKRVHDVLNQIEPQWIGISNLKLIGARNPIAQDVVEFQSRYPARIPTVFRGTQLGNVGIEEAYIYEPPRPRKRNRRGI